MPLWLAMAPQWCHTGVMNLETYASNVAAVIPAFTTPDPIAVSIELSVGGVRVVASDRANTVVQVRPSDESRAADVRDAGQTRVELTPAGLLMGARPRGLGVLGKPVRSTSRSSCRRASACTATPRSRPSTAPAGSARSRSRPRSATSTSTRPAALTQHRAGAIAVARVGGDAEISTGTGRIRVGQIDGAAVVKNSNGGTRIDAVAGELRISAGNGDLTVGRADGNVTADAAHGEIKTASSAAAPPRSRPASARSSSACAPALPLTSTCSPASAASATPSTRPTPPTRPVPPLVILARTSHGDITIRPA